MRIAVTAETAEGLDAPVAQHFGHAPFFVLVDTSGPTATGCEVVANPFLEGHQPGQIPQFISDQRAEVMLSGGMGGRAIQFFTSLGIEAATGAAGTVAESVTAYLAGHVRGAQPCDDSVAHGHG